MSDPKFPPCPQCGARGFSTQEFRDKHVAGCRVGPSQYTTIGDRAGQDLLDHAELVDFVDFLKRG